MRKSSLIILFTFNCILLSSGWIMAFYVYPRLPQNIPLWLNFIGQQIILTEKSRLFFIYPLIQTVFVLSFLIASRIISSKNPIPEEKFLLKEYIYLSLIFFNMIFIHIQRSIIFLAFKLEKGINQFYFLSLFCFILILIPCYRLRRKIMIKSQK